MVLPGDKMERSYLEAVLYDLLVDLPGHEVALY